MHAQNNINFKKFQATDYRQENKFFKLCTQNHILISYYGIYKDTHYKQIVNLFLIVTDLYICKLVSYQLKTGYQNKSTNQLSSAFLLTLRYHET